MGNIDQNFRWLLGHINLSALPSLNFVSMHGCASFYPATLSQWPWRWVSTMSQSKLDAMNGAFDLDRWHLLDANCCAKRTNIIWREIISHTHTQSGNAVTRPKTPSFRVPKTAPKLGPLPLFPSTYYRSLPGAAEIVPSRLKKQTQDQVQSMRSREQVNV